MDLRARIGIDCGRQLAIEDAVGWAAKHGISYLEVEADHAPNALESFTAERCRPVRAMCEKHGIHLGLHTLSAVNVGETSPFVRDAVDRYLEGYVDAAIRVGAEWIVVHAGFHFGSDKARRMASFLPELTTDRTETPAPGHPLGTKGVGEAGTIASTPAVVNAVVDALRPFGVNDVPMPCTPERVWRAIQEGGAK